MAYLASYYALRELLPSLLGSCHRGFLPVATTLAMVKLILNEYFCCLKIFPKLSLITHRNCFFDQIVGGIRWSEMNLTYLRLVQFIGDSDHDLGDRVRPSLTF